METATVISLLLGWAPIEGELQNYWVLWGSDQSLYIDLDLELGMDWNGDKDFAKAFAFTIIGFIRSNRLQYVCIQHWTTG
ncbi:hypothetical protein [Paenibacillus sp. 23TSA30-6]|uniref:hypothetical protein n=1 Tax=Paenibacillus sp. 23TSA30-6 TaxID=2546104 RepID=UPI001787EC09|nr:hypothetical protein [Paenibacillus sp. 23TSA30-6]MBE0335246.1 hypothetical protein [Paenibacillus sp. 23TSA30-6]